MKKFLKSGLFVFLALCLIVGLGVKAEALTNSCNQVFAENASTLRQVSLEYDSSLLQVDKLIYVVDGIQVEYDRKGFVVDDETFCYKATFSGETGALGLMSGEAREEFFESEPFSDTLYSLGFSVSANRIPMDDGHDFYVALGFKDDASVNTHYVRTLSYKVGGSTIYSQIDQASLDDDRNGKFTAVYQEGVGYVRTVNDAYTFNYDYLNNGKGFELKVAALNSNIALNFAISEKLMGVTFSGAGFSIGSSSISDIRYGDEVVITLAPEENEIIDEVEVYFGSTKILTLYGGMVTGDDYTFKGNSLHENTLAYGNFAFGYESELEFKQVALAGGNYAKMGVITPSSDAESFVVTINDAGVITFSSSKVSRWLEFKITTMKYVQVDLMDNSEPFQSVQLGEGADAKIYTENLPNRIFALGFSDTIYVKTEVKENYNYVDMNASLISGNAYVNPTFEGGKLEIKATKTNAYIFRLDLKKAGVNFKDSSTKIYVSTREDVESVSDFTPSELALTSASGYVELLDLDPNTVVKIYVSLSPYYKMNIGGDEFACVYTNFDFVMDTNRNLVISIELLNFVRPVYYEGEIIGALSVKLSSVQVVGGAYNATYETEFLSVETGAEFSTITSTNPWVYGYKFLNMKVGDTAFLTRVSGVEDAFNIPNNDYAIHKFVAEMVFNADGEEQKIEATFTEKLNQFLFGYNGQAIYGYAYYGASEMYLTSAVNVVETGKYFAGLRVEQNGNILTAYTIEGEEPVFDPFQSGTYKYSLQSPWSMDLNNDVLEALIEYRTFNITFVFTSSDTETEDVVAKVKYGDYINVFNANTEGISAPTIGKGYNLIGWNISELDNFIISDDEPDFLYGDDILYEYEFDLRLIPVFSAGVAVVTIYDQNEEYLTSTRIRYGEVASLEALLFKNGDWIVPSVFGFNLLGFYDSTINGNLIVEYVDGNGYRFNYLDTYFELTDDGFVWTPPVVEDVVQNINLYARFDAETYTMTIALLNSELRENAGVTDVTVSNAEVREDNGNFLATGFDITDSLNIGNIQPNSVSYISGINIIVLGADGVTEVLETKLFEMVCDRDGNLEAVLETENFLLENYLVTFKVEDFINEDTQGMQIVLEIEYTPISYIISFAGLICDESGNVMVGDAEQKLYYKVNHSNATIASFEHWVQCDEEGNELAEGWADLELAEAEVVFTSQTLFGISGIFYEHSGVTYSFKAWKSGDFLLGPELELTKGYDFVAMFSDESDVNIDYYIYNDVSASYELVSHQGYFWTYNPISEDYSMETNIVTANSYEIYLIGGKLYYISLWSESKLTSFTVSSVGGYEMNVAYDVHYSSEVIFVNFYAIYQEFKFEVIDNPSSTNYEANISVPNDANGNSYVESDIVWVEVSKSLYDAYDSTELSPADRISAILGVSGDSFRMAIIGTGPSMDKSNHDSDDTYLFMVLQRKVDGNKTNNCYLVEQVV